MGAVMTWHRNSNNHCWLCLSLSKDRRIVELSPMAFPFTKLSRLPLPSMPLCCYLFKSVSRNSDLPVVFVSFTHCRDSGEQINSAPPLTLIWEQSLQPDPCFSRESMKAKPLPLRREGLQSTRVCVRLCVCVCVCDCVCVCVCVCARA